ncbi:hypothetical protein [Limimaricola cinnabarinus]|uniref:hypothetical protein n=1 Tax=Limimaricola cinnabarinus TaxID=1125964 RepID=UPI002FE39AC4
MTDAERAKQGTCNTPEPDGKIARFDVVATPIMPEGFFAIRTAGGATVLGPNGSFFVPFGSHQR